MISRFSGLLMLLGLLVSGCASSTEPVKIDLDILITAAGEPLAVRGRYLEPYTVPDDAAYYALLLAGHKLKGSDKMAAISEAFAQLPDIENSGPTVAMNRALIAAPIAVSNLDREVADLACDYDWVRAATWRDALARTRTGAALSGRLGPYALGFITSEQNIEEALWMGDIARLEGAGIVYVDLSRVSKGYVGEVVSRLVNGMRQRDVRSHIGNLALIRTISVVEQIGDSVLLIGALLSPSEVRAAPHDRC